MRDVMLILHFIGLAMGMGVSFAHAFLGIAAGKMTAEEGIKFRLHTMVLGRMGQIGLGLLIVSGIYLIIPFWPNLMDTPLLMIKLALVILLMILVTLIGRGAKKAAAGDAAANLMKIAPLGKLTLLVGIAIIILAIKIFH